MVGNEATKLVSSRFSQPNYVLHGIDGRVFVGAVQTLHDDVGIRNDEEYDRRSRLLALEFIVWNQHPVSLQLGQRVTFRNS